jgi:hypothetical protein
MSDILSGKQGFQHARHLSPEGAIAARGFRQVKDTRSSDEGILAPAGEKNVRQLTYGKVSQDVDAGPRILSSRLLSSIRKEPIIFKP